MAVTPTPRVAAGPPFLRWGGIFAGAIVGLAILFLFNSFWTALANGSDIDFVARNVHWFGLASSLVALFAGGLVAGWMSDHPGTGPGLFDGLTVWALILVGTLILDVPSSLEVFGFTAAPLSEWGADPLWATFWSLLGGLVVALVGGVLGGGMPRPAWAPTGSYERDTAEVERPAAEETSGGTTVAGRPAAETGGGTTVAGDRVTTQAERPSRDETPDEARG